MPLKPHRTQLICLPTIRTLPYHDDFPTFSLNFTSLHFTALCRIEEGFLGKLVQTADPVHRKDPRKVHGKVYRLSLDVLLHIVFYEKQISQRALYLLFIVAWKWF
jgi:hypothetical protein